MSINSCEFLLLIVTPEDGTKVVLPEPISTSVYLDPTGIATEEFAGIVRFIPEEVESKTVLDASAISNVNAVLFVIILVCADSVLKRLLI